MKIKTLTCRLSMLLLTSLLLNALGPRASAAPFIAGNLAVVQAGDGSAALGGNGTPQFVLEFLPSAANQSGPVQTIVIPTNGATRLTIAGNATSEGHIARSLDSSILTIQGYNAPIGAASLSSSPATGTNRCVGQLDDNGNYTRPVTDGNTAFTTGSTRSTISDGANYWISGSGASAGEGIWYSAGGAAPTAITTGVNTRVTKIFNGKLYYTTSTALSGYTGEPASSSSATATGITGSSLYDFSFNAAGTVAYVCDDSAQPTGGIIKWTNNGTAWVKGYTFGSANGLTAGCRSVVVDYSGANPVLYATTADTQTKLIKLVDTSVIGATSDTADQATTLAVAPNNTAYRSVAFVPPSSSTGTAPAITGISPTSITNSPGTNVTFTLSGGVGYPTATAFWYQIVGSTTNLLSGQTNAILTLNNITTAATGQYFTILTNASGSATSSLATLTVISAPTISSISPTNATNNAGTTVTFTLTSTPGNPPASNFWYQIVGNSTNLIPTAIGTTLTLSNVLGGDTAGYFAVLTNASGKATSSVALLTVLNDPIIQVEPSSVQGLTNGTVQFSITAFGTTPLNYQWFYSDASGDLIAPVGNGTLGASTVSGATSNILTIADLQDIDVTNFVVIATNIYGAVTSSVASFAPDINLSTPVSLVSAQGILALWDFDGPQFTNTAVNPDSLNNPAPFIGYGTASAVGTCAVPGTSPFSGSTDPADVGNPDGEGFVFTPFGFEQPSPNFSWGTEDYPAATNYPAGVALGGNKQNGVQFNVSTVGARNIKVSYDSRVSSTASDYERLQYTTNGTDWVDYPASSTFSGLSSSTGNGGYYNFAYDLTGFPGVDNNPYFGVRVVTEWVSTATYGIIQSNFWAAVANSSYDSGASGNYAAGTVTYDVVAVQGDAITNNNTAPVISSFVNTNMTDTNILTLNFTASSSQMTASDLTFSAQSLNMVAAGPFTQTVNPTLHVVPEGGNNFALQISFTPNNYIPDPMDAAPILVTATDTNGESASTWFTLTVGAINQPPTNTLTAISSTNMLANTSLTIPFTVGSARNPSSNFTFTVTSDNNTVIPYANAVISGNTNTGNLFLTVTPAANEVGNAVINVAVDDNDPDEQRTSTANIAFVVRPNPNVVAIDYFNYDNSGALDTIAPSYWQHLSGVTGGLQVGGGTATVSDQTTENMQARLINAPFNTNSGGALYYSCTVNVNSSYPPYTNGSYFIALNNGSGNTADVEDLLVATTNGVTTPGDYRLGIANVVGATGASAQIFPQDLAPGVNYVIITALTLSNGFSTLWINPTNLLSPHVTDTTPAASQTNLYNITDIELRESGTSEGVINVGQLTVGTAFNNVFYPPRANPETLGVIENSNPSLVDPLPDDGGSDLAITSVSPGAYGTAAILGGTNIAYTPNNGFTGSDSINYTVTDDLGETSSATITLDVTNAPPLAAAITNTVAENSANNLFNVLTNDVLETPGGTLGLVSVSETDGNGTASTSGNNVLFTPGANFLGAATINYTITDNLGGNSSSTISVNVVNLTPPPVGAALVSGGNLVISWSNPAFSLQTTTNLLGPWVTIPGAVSPYTNTITTNVAGYFRLVH